MRYFFHIGYSGTNYSGWQRHPYGLGVQQVLETSIKQVLKVPVNLVGCGRTDAGVHASQFFFHLDLEQEWAYDLLFRLNKVLPPDIAIFDIIPMEGLPHARFDATHRSYDYFIHTYKDPFLNDSSTLYLEPNLHLDKMKEATALLLKYTDYRAFCKTPAQHDNTICHITEAGWFADAQGGKLRFHISANRFVRRMIRLVVGKLLKVGSGTLSVAEFESYLATLQPPDAFSVAHPQGLYLSKVTYPYLDLPAKAGFATAFQSQGCSYWQAV
ncbi:tRNA pseudouridine synthase A [Pontibacter akesuensis]|uniref:tRNA pseudouridine synthase A n=1 Tax=Pontibacter akesuensis TaxID=388950 RepID=A0A1I7J6V8_9BACT|nr:tRNA pseudouridine synthase A [Pontibacter akesuensis]GHA72061.1 tRNA pseudouridine synthase A [Pontibacter akesuensis]SFU80861.1 tRNA pseudouridine38-40 synthase [Pontibacter akesuensis]